MSLNVFYYLHIDNKFVNLIDLDEILCKMLNVEVSSEEYYTPEGNSVCWVDMLTGILLELPSHIKTKNLVLDEIIDAVYHYNSMYRIDKVNSYVRCFYCIHVLNIKINAHYANLSMFDEKGREYYRNLYDKEEWLSKKQLLDYVMSLWNPSVTDKTTEQIVNEIYIERKKKEDLILRQRCEDEAMITRLNGEKGEIVRILEKYIDSCSNTFLDEEVRELWMDIRRVYDNR